VDGVNLLEKTFYPNHYNRNKTELRVKGQMTEPPEEVKVADPELCARTREEVERKNTDQRKKTKPYSKVQKDTKEKERKDGLKKRKNRAQIRRGSFGV